MWHEYGVGTRTPGHREKAVEVFRPLEGEVLALQAKLLELAPRRAPVLRPEGFPDTGKPRARSLGRPPSGFPAVCPHRGPWRIP